MQRVLLFPQAHRHSGCRVVVPGVIAGGGCAGFGGRLGKRRRGGAETQKAAPWAAEEEAGKAKARHLEVAAPRHTCSTRMAHRQASGGGEGASLSDAEGAERLLKRSSVRLPQARSSRQSGPD